MRIELDYKFINLNEMINLSRGNKYFANTHKKKEMEYVKWATLKVPKITEYPIKVEVIWHVKNKCFDLIKENSNIFRIDTKKYIRWISKCKDIKE